MTTLFETELREQPAALERLLAQGRGPAEDFADAIRRRAPRFVVLAARGSSDNAARYAQYLLGIQNRLVAALATPSVFTHYGAQPSLSGALVVGISQSGQSPDIIAVVREARRQGAPTLVVTNDPASPLASIAEMVLPLVAGPEHAVAATKSYTAQLMALAMLSAALRGEAQPWEELQRVPALVARALELGSHAVSGARMFARDERLIVLGRGYNLSTAFEITLKVKETSGVMADGYSSADFLHGPKAIADRSLPILVVASGQAFADLDGVVGLAKEKGAPLIAISERPGILAAAELAIPLPAATPEWLSPLVAVVPGQLFALGLSLARGGNPDAPPGLSKVTQTT